ncbi:MAG: Gfo/Idh/MocA family oxidoreductase [Ruminococcaceae bacterium]|nr:Gfo/Idh/MocA family oxidoreductase [Oscillospiraceae bacterium]
MEKIRVGLVGCGGIANGAHLPPMQAADGAVVTALCDLDPQRLHTTADKYKIAGSYRFLDYHDLVASDVVDAVDICTPNNSHCPIAMAAVAAGKPFCVEKPVGVHAFEAKELLAVTEAAGLPAMVCFSYRFKPAVHYARRLLEEGKIGQVISVYAQYLKASAFMKGRRLDWRFVQEVARYGVSGDLAVHMIDLLAYLIGDFKAVCAQTGIVVKERLRLDKDELAPVDTDDYCNFLAELQGDIPASFGISRCAIGNANHIVVDLYGTKGCIRFDLNKDDEIQLCIDDGTGKDLSMETIKVPRDGVPKQMQSWIDLIRQKPPACIPTLKDGVACQSVLDALLESADKKQWVKL